MQIVNESDRGNDLVVLPYLPRQVERQIVMIGILLFESTENRLHQPLASQLSTAR